MLTSHISCMIPYCTILLIAQRTFSWLALFALSFLYVPTHSPTYAVHQYITNTRDT